MLPEKFLERQQKMLGGEYDAFLRSFEQNKYQALRVNPLKQRMGGAAQDEALQSAESEAQQDTGSGGKQGAGKELPTEVFGLNAHFKLTQVSWEKSGYYYTAEDQPGRHPLHEAGVYYIQEPSAMAVVPLLEVQPGEKILDLCAAPGGKSTQLAGYLKGRGLLVSNEIHPARAKILSENIERMCVRNACVTNENPTKLSEKFGAYFDRILVDAPCSGEGMFRKNEAACEEWSPENVVLCADRQDEILDCAARMLRPGGRIVYSTCTFAPEEDEGTVSRFLKRHPEFVLLPIDKEAMGLPAGRCDGRQDWAEYGGMAPRDEGQNCRMEPEASRDAELDCRIDMRYEDEEMYSHLVHENMDYDLSGTLRLWPHVVKGEGHFAAVFQNTMTQLSFDTMAQGGLEKEISPKDKELDPWWEFCRETLKEVNRDTAEDMVAGQPLSHSIFLRFGENLYLAPDCMPSLKGLKVLRTGLQLGTLKKNRFEPSHALALALSSENVRHICHFCTDDREQMGQISAYLGGQTFPMEGEKGWYLITVDGYSLGWGKLAGGIMKNHYPKGLRKN